jgi:hypothetical protein
MKKYVLASLVFMAVALILTSCGGSSRITVATSTNVDLARSICYIPTLANVQVQPTKVTATMTSTEMEGLNAEQKKQAVVAKAVATAKADILVVPSFTTKKNAEGKLASMTVTGYPAKISSFRPLSTADSPFLKQIEAKQDKVSGRMVVNTMTVAEMEYGPKTTLTLSPADIGLAGQTEQKVLAYAKEKLLRQEKADVLYEPQYIANIVDGKVSTFTLTAFPGRYAKYRTISTSEMERLNVGTKPTVLYNTTADIKAVSPRVQLKFATNNATAKESELKELARATALAKYNADFLLNETFYFDYADKVITHVTICGTPAVYTNWRPLKAGDIVDTRIMGLNGEAADVEEEKPKSFVDQIIGLFKKKK